MPPPFPSAPMLPPPWPSPVAGDLACGGGEGVEALSATLTTVAELTARARDRVVAAAPRLWDGTAARTFAARREDDLARLDHLVEAVEQARAAVLAHTVARRDLAASLSGTGAARGGRF